MLDVIAALQIPGYRRSACGIESYDEYIFIGNEHVHAHKPIWKMLHEKLTPQWLYSRAVNGSREFIATWCRSQSSSA